MSRKRYIPKPSFLYKKNLDPPQSLKATDFISYEQLLREAGTLRRMRRIIHNKPSVSKLPRFNPKYTHTTENLPFLEQDSGLHLSPHPSVLSCPQSPRLNQTKEIDIPFLIYKHTGEIVQVSPTLNDKVFPLPQIDSEIKERRGTVIEYISGMPSAPTKPVIKSRLSEPVKKCFFLTSCSPRLPSYKNTILSKLSSPNLLIPS
jgi:hypothetical protein